MGGLCVFRQGEGRIGGEEKSKRRYTYVNALNPTELMVRQGILNLEKGYEFDPIWSESGYKNLIEKKVKFTKR